MTHEISNNTFWEAFCDLVEILYTTNPPDRLGIVVPYMEEHFGPTNTDAYRRIENHVMRTVSWMETIDRAEEEG